MLYQPSVLSHGYHTIKNAKLHWVSCFNLNKIYGDSFWRRVEGYKNRQLAVFLNRLLKDWGMAASRTQL